MMAEEEREGGIAFAPKEIWALLIHLSPTLTDHDRDAGTGLQPHQEPLLGLT